MGAFLGDNRVQVVAVCDVNRETHAIRAFDRPVTASTKPSADFCAHEPGYLYSPHPSGKPYSRVRITHS